MIGMSAQEIIDRLRNSGTIMGSDYIQRPSQQPINQQQPNTGILNNGMFTDPFGTAMSGGQSGTLQPYINRMTQNASNALYGGLLNYQPQSMIAGNAGGTPQNSTVPQGFNIPSALQNYMNGQGLNFGNRSWMQGGGNG